MCVNCAGIHDVFINKYSVIKTSRISQSAGISTGDVTISHLDVSSTKLMSCVIYLSILCSLRRDNPVGSVIDSCIYMHFG